ncbi:SDR family oxidoreductase [Thalassobacillus sp. CUG 92003]|uniref:SDR family oxidoreductase n=1 Tax=Thalassobacillus sp. CUG 92003 TaxID=2736641 RepID=UPI0015E78C05|nr:SDR family oxidoreductase [Thalassobacillus sp. CUG 92003]
MDVQLKGKSVIVMASSKGLGKATAAEFAREGAHVLISSRDEAELKQTASEIIHMTGNKQVDYHVCDITKPERINSLVQKAVDWNGKVDVLINNAGGPPAGTFEDFTDEDWQQAFELNLLSFIRAIRAVLPYMKAQKEGKIVNIASSSIQQTLDNLILSNTYRAGIVGLAKSLSQELAPYNILINTVGPGKIATDRVAQLDASQAEKMNLSTEQVREKAEQAIPIGRYGEPAEFAKTLVFLASGSNTYMTGQAFVVDGGLVKAL